MFSHGAIYVVSFPQKRCAIILSTTYLRKSNRSPFVLNVIQRLAKGAVFQSCHTSHRAHYFGTIPVILILVYE